MHIKLKRKHTHTHTHTEEPNTTSKEMVLVIIFFIQRIHTPKLHADTDSQIYIRSHMHTFIFTGVNRHLRINGILSQH